VQGCFKPIICVWRGAPRRLVVFQMMFQTYLVCKFLHCFSYSVRSGLCVGRAPRFIFALGQNCLKVDLILSTVSLVGHTCCCDIAGIVFLELGAHQLPLPILYCIWQSTCYCIFLFLKFEISNALYFVFHCSFLDVGEGTLHTTSYQSLQSPMAVLWHLLAQAACLKLCVCQAWGS
jgi:hypothetical protein